ncbi:MAG: ATP-dependent helicase HrpB [Oceanospirillaceae bacterium]|nr:ATP-dependent helicase HrpB [Oceanospirillaceae bacterium]
MTSSDLSSSLPIDSVLDDIRSRLNDNPSLLLVAEPGAGKTTRVPLALMEESWLGDKTIVMLEPRRLAARNAATFMAKQMGEAVGETVGYRIRLENRTSAQTRILVVTEGILARMLQSDPELSDVGLIIFDEFHERHLHSDLALALSHQCQQLLRDDLKLLLMSATLDSDTLSELLQAPVVQCPGRGYGVTTQYRAKKQPQESLTDHCTRVITEALQDEHQEGHLLVFLPGTREIIQLKRNLDEVLSSAKNAVSKNAIHVLPLHGRLTDKEQKQALSPVGTSERKVILATNIAESSLTLDGVRIVIDSGLEKRLSFNASSGISRLTRRRISQASSVQREGRAGRQAPGWCYRLWPETEQSRMTTHIEAEITQADLSHLSLELLQWGANADELLWLTPPPKPALTHAHHLLTQLGILDGNGLTESGKQASTFGLDPRWASALIKTARHAVIELPEHQAMECIQAACTLVAMIQTGITPTSTDDIERQWLARHSMTGVIRQRWSHQVKPLAKRWFENLSRHLPIPLKQTPSSPGQNRSDDSVSNGSAAEPDIAAMIALAWPDRIARLRSSDDERRYQLSNGTGASLLTDSSLQGQPYLAVIDTSESRDGETLIRSAIALQDHHIEKLSGQIPDLMSEHIKVEWQDSGALLAESQRCIGRWVWRRARLGNLSTSQWQQAWRDWFSTATGLSALNWDDKTRQLQARMMRVGEHLEFEEWPDVSESGLIDRTDDWLLPFLNGTRHQRDLKKLNLHDLLLNQLSWDQQQQLNSLAPECWKVASGSRIKLDYLENPPVLAVKLQELFGYEEQPAILGGRLPLMIHLLSPAKRPVQITQDLPHFWRNSYEAVRKDLRGKYPKHPWPEDPLSAEATALTNRALRARK